MLRNFRTTLVLIILISASVPVILFSSLLVKKIYNITREAAVREANLTAKSVSDLLNHEVDLIISRLVTIGSNSDVALATRKTPLGFRHYLGERAPAYIRNFISENPLVSVLRLFDSELQAVIEAPGSVRAGWPESVLKNAKEMLSNPAGDARTGYRIVEFRDENFINQMTMPGTGKASQDPNDRPESSYGIVLLVPVVFDVTNETYGVLAAMISFENLAGFALSEIKLPGTVDFFKNDIRIVSSPAFGNQEDIISGEILFDLGNPKSGQKHRYTLRISEPFSGRFSEITDSIRNLILLIVLAVLLVTLFAYTFARHLSAALNSLILIVQSYADGIYNLPRPEGIMFSEFRQIADVLGEMGNRIISQITEMRKAEEKYRSIFENAAEGMFQTTPEGSFLAANPSMVKILGYNSLEEMLSTVTNIPKQTYAGEERRKEFLSLLKQNRRVVGFETQIHRKDGSEAYVSVSTRTVRDTNGRVLYCEGSMVDITERKKREKAERQQKAAETVSRKIMESIRYARMIQRSLLPNPENIKGFIPDSFSVWMPRDIVGGDFIYMDCIGGGLIIAVIDCTGHGVPGAFMTMIAAFGLRKIIRDEGYHDPAQILKRLSFMVQTMLHQDTDYALSDDGLDAAICFVKPRETYFSGSFGLIFAGAKLPLVYIRDGEVTVVKGDRQSLGYKRSDINFDFSDHTIKIDEGMSFYMFSDGFPDQPGGEKNRRFGTRGFINLLEKNAHCPFDEQREKLLEAFHTHMGKNERRDDVTVVGFGF
ncbi:PAS domain S-box protein [Desulfococcaceae bacterium HSG8]|nr:PAS domain S-box protein [Desulfococcaceae bacterium HSG8]